MRKAALLFAVMMSASLGAQNAPPDWAKIDEETLRHFQAIIKVDSTDPPGREAGVVDYVKQVSRKTASPSRSSRRKRIAPTWWRASRAPANSGRC